MPSEMKVLSAFLFDGLTHREIDLRLGRNPAKSKGWISFDIMRKRFHVRGEDRGTLFLSTKRDAVRLLNRIARADNRAAVVAILTRIPTPSVLAPYRGTYAIADSPRALQRMLGGEARNAVQRLFQARKKAHKRCQMPDCDESRRLEVAHLMRDRPSLFIAAAAKHAKRESGRLVFNVSDVMEDYLRRHVGLRAVAFLCPQHHRFIDDLRNQEPGQYRSFVKVLAAGLHAGASL